MSGILEQPIRQSQQMPHARLKRNSVYSTTRVTNTQGQDSLISNSVQTQDSKYPLKEISV